MKREMKIKFHESYSVGSVKEYLNPNLKRKKKVQNFSRFLFANRILPSPRPLTCPSPSIIGILRKNRNCLFQQKKVNGLEGALGLLLIIFLLNIENNILY